MSEFTSNNNTQFIIYQTEGKLAPDVTVKNYLTVRQKGKRLVNRSLDLRVPKLKLGEQQNMQLVSISYKFSKKAHEQLSATM